MSSPESPMENNLNPNRDASPGLAWELRVSGSGDFPMLLLGLVSDVMPSVIMASSAARVLVLKPPNEL